MLTLFAALLLSLQPQSNPIGEAAAGLRAEIEDDNGPDAMMTAIASAGCTVTIGGVEGRRWTLDMTRTQAVALEDTFVYVAAGEAKLAIVGEASRPDQAAKLRALADALTALASRCTPPR